MEEQADSNGRQPRRTKKDLASEVDRLRRRAAELEAAGSNGAAEIRAARHGVDPRGFTEAHHHFDVWTKQNVADAFAKSTPLEREYVLDQTRWRWLDELALEDPYGFAAVAAHALKLRLMTRWARLDEETGRRTLDQTLETLLQTSSSESS